MTVDPELPDAELQSVFGASQIDPAHVAIERVYEPVASASSGIWRVALGSRTAILKLVAHSAEGHPNWRSGEDPAHWYYWRREVLAYESGLLESLTGGLRAPDCPLIAPRADGSVALWLEDLRSQPATAWPVARVRRCGPAPRPDAGCVRFRTCASRTRLVEPGLVAELSAPTRRRPGAPRSDRALEPSPPRTVVSGPAGRPPPRDAARSAALPGRARCAAAHAVSSRPAPGQPLRRRRRRLDDRDRLVIRRHRCDRRRRGQPRTRRSARLPCRTGASRPAVRDHRRRLHGRLARRRMAGSRLLGAPGDDGHDRGEVRGGSRPRCCEPSPRTAPTSIDAPSWRASSGGHRRLRSCSTAPTRRAP